jgi:hypothetical protein
MSALSLWKIQQHPIPIHQQQTSRIGLSRVNCDEGKPMIQIGFEWDKISRSYEVISFPQSNTTQSNTTSIRIKDQAREEKLSSNNCEALTNLTFPDYKIVSFELITPKQTLCKCNHTLNITSLKILKLGPAMTIISTIVI